MKILTAKEIRKAEEISFKTYFSEAELMKRAGRECSEKIIKYYGNEIKIFGKNRFFKTAFFKTFFYS